MRVIGAIVAFLSVTATQAKWLEKRQESPTPTPTVNVISVFSVLQTALPPELVGLALTNSASASMLIASQFRQGSTPAWFTALPTDVQSFLVPFATSFPGAQLSSAAARATSTITATEEEETTSTTTRSSSTRESDTTSTTESESSATEAASSSSSAGASMPTAVVGAGIAGVIGVVGLILA